MFTCEYYTMMGPGRERRKSVDSMKSSASFFVVESDDIGPSDESIWESVADELYADDGEVRGAPPCTSVHYFLPFTQHRSHVFGVLLVTNYRILFKRLISDDKCEKEDVSIPTEFGPKYCNGAFDVPLALIERIEYQRAEPTSSVSSPSLPPAAASTSALTPATRANRYKLMTKAISTKKGKEKHLNKVKIVTKDFRVLEFGFDPLTSRNGVKVLNAIFNSAHEKRSALLFALPASLFAFEDASTISKSLLYSSRDDWLAEMKQCEIVSELGSKWTIVDQRVDRLCDSYSRHFVTLQFHSTSHAPGVSVAERTTNVILHEDAPYFNENQLPTWCYTAANGAVLMRCAEFDEHVCVEKTQEIWYRWRAALKRSVKTPAKHLPSPIFPSPRKSHLNQFTQSSYNHVDENAKEHDTSHLASDVRLGDEQHAPDAANAHKLQQAYTALRLITDVVSDEERITNERRIKSLLASSNWPTCVMQTLSVTEMIVEKMVLRAESVYVRDITADNLVCVVCALVQACIEPVYRTKRGLCRLLSKEFSARGYQFGRNHYGIDNESSTRRSAEEPNFMVPYLLLFIDCLNQLMILYPCYFEFTHVYTASLYSTVLSGHCMEFTHNNHEEVEATLKEGEKGLVSLHALEKFYRYDHARLFNNPLYNMRQRMGLSDDKVNLDQALLVDLGPNPSNSQSVEDAEYTLQHWHYRVFDELMFSYHTPTVIRGGGRLSEITMLMELWQRMEKTQRECDVLRRQLQAETPMPAVRHKQSVSQQRFYANAPHTLPFIDASQIDPQFGYAPVRDAPVQLMSYIPSEADVTGALESHRWALSEAAFQNKRQAAQHNSAEEIAMNELNTNNRRSPHQTESDTNTLHEEVVDRERLSSFHANDALKARQRARLQHVKDKGGPLHPVATHSRAQNTSRTNTTSTSRSNITMQFAPPQPDDDSDTEVLVPIYYNKEVIDELRGRLRNNNA